MKQENTFQTWMEKNCYTDVRFYPRNTNAYGVADMLEYASYAIELYESGNYTTYEDNIESFIEETITLQ